MSQEKPLRFPDWLVIFQTASLLLWGLIPLFLIKKGFFQRFVDPAYGVLGVAGAVILILMAVANLRRFLVIHIHEEDCLRDNIPCAYKHRLRLQHIVSVLVFLIPLVLLAGVRPKAPRIWFLDHIIGDAFEQYQLFLSKDISGRQTQTVMDLQREDLQGTEFTVIGQLILPFEVPRQFKFNQAYLVTVGIWSIAPACRPVVLIVEYPPAYEPKGVPWVEVRGVVKSLKWDEARKAVVLEADSLEQFKELTEPPPFPYFRATRSKPLLNPLQ